MNNTPDTTHLHIPLFIDHARQGAYFTIPFTMPDNIESFTLEYSYERHHHATIAVENGSFTSRTETNIIDLGLIAPDGKQVGASGSDKLSITINETHATPGYHPWKLVPGEWQIIVGAYKVADEGVEVQYELTFTFKYLRLLKGDLHTHTNASDGVSSLDELIQHARINSLDYLAITNHNHMLPPDALPQDSGLSLISGMEWTHFKGHANFLGVYNPYDEPFFANTMDEVRSRFESAQRRGALVVINHPLDSLNPFQFDVNLLPFDCLEIWKGMILESNLNAIAWWQSLLVAGKKIPVCGGSDYHEDAINRRPGGPTTFVYAMSNSVADILSALRQGHAFIAFDPHGPVLEMNAGDAIMGDSVEFSRVKRLEYTARGLLGGDEVHLITGQGNTLLVKAPADGQMHGVYDVPAPGFVRVEILRNFAPGLPLLPALVSNPIYFDA